MNWLANFSRSLARGFTALSPGCKAAARLQSEATARELSRLERTGLRLHLFLCKWCRRYAAQLRFLRSATRQSEEHDISKPPPQLSPEARERIKQRLQSSQR